MRELTKEEQEMLREEKVTMAKLAREELQAFLDSGLPVRLVPMGMQRIMPACSTGRRHGGGSVTRTARK